MKDWPASREVAAAGADKAVVNARESVESLYFSFPPSAITEAVEFELRPATCAVLTGPSGVGKTTLLRRIADLDPHDGEVRLGVASQAAVPAPLWRKRVMYVPSESGWWAARVKDHFAITKDLQAMLESFGLKPEKLDMPASQLSSGERQRMSLLRALSFKPQFLLLDEPTSALDHETVLKVEDVLGVVKSSGCGLLIVTHDSAQAERLADARIFMRARS